MFIAIGDDPEAGARTWEEVTIEGALPNDKVTS